MFSFAFPRGVTALNGETITFADIADLDNLRLVTTGDDLLQLAEGSIAQGSDVYATYTIDGNVVSLQTSGGGGPTLSGYTWAE